jgi:MFS family permease
VTTTVDRPAVQRRVLAVLVVAQVLGGVGVATGIALSSLAAAQLAGSDIVGGAALTCMVVGTAATALPISRLAARSGRRPALLLGFGLAAVGAVIAAAAIAVGNWPVLLAGLVAFGAATAAGLAARFAATDLAQPHRRARALAVVVWAATVGVVAGPNLAAPVQDLAAASGLVPASGPFVLAAVAFVLAALTVGVGLRPDPMILARADAALQDRAGPATPDRAAWRVLVEHRAAVLAASAIALAQMVMVGLMSLTPVHMDHGGASLRLVGLVISLHVAGMYILSPVFGVLADRWGRLPVLAVGAALLVTAGIVAGPAAATDAIRLTVGLVALGLGWSAALIAGSALLTDAVPLDERARAQGLSDFVMNVAGALGGILAGVVVATTSFTVLGLAVAATAAPLVVVVLVVGARRDAGFAPSTDR